MGLCEQGLDCILNPGSDPWTYNCRAYCDDEHPCTTGTCQSVDGFVGWKFCMP
jgi:hypothetical protein